MFRASCKLSFAINIKDISFFLQSIYLYIVYYIILLKIYIIENHSKWNQIPIASRESLKHGREYYFSRDRNYVIINSCISYLF